MKRFFLSAILVAAILSGFTTGCRSAEVLDNPWNMPDRELTVEEATEVTGLPIPLPTYLPEGYQISSVKLKASGRGAWDITLTIGKSEVTSEDTHNAVLLVVRWFSTGIKLPDLERIKIGNSTAVVFRYPDYIQLVWWDKTGRELTLTGNQELQLEELVKIAESVTSPPDRVLEARLDPQDDLIVFRGDSRQIIIHLQNNSSKTLKVSVSQDTDLPTGIAINVRDGSLTLKPGLSVDVVVDVKIAANAPSPAWPYRPASSVLPKDVPPPANPITEAPYYYLLFTYKYEASGLVPVQDMLSTRLRVDPSSVLPPGMATLQEAEEAADFPVAVLLPSYLPEGVSPPPLGYGIGTKEPHSITVFYSAFLVVLSPEPGVSQPPEGLSGDKTTIRNNPVVIGKDRIDWWRYDIHFTVISDEVPMSELRLVAESMMLVGPFSGSWLGIGP
jgi:hypothetical protein